MELASLASEKFISASRRQIKKSEVCLVYRLNISVWRSRVCNIPVIDDGDHVWWLLPSGISLCTPFARVSGYSYLCEARYVESRPRGTLFAIERQAFERWSTLSPEREYRSATSSSLLGPGYPSIIQFARAASFFAEIFGVPVGNQRSERWRQCCCEETPEECAKSNPWTFNLLLSFVYSGCSGFFSCLWLTEWGVRWNWGAKLRVVVNFIYQTWNILSGFL